MKQAWAKEVNAYFSARAPHYSRDSARGVWAWVREREWRAVRRALGASFAGERVLEVGGGAGFYGARLAGQAGSYLVLEPSAPMAEICRAQGLAVEITRLEERSGEGNFDCVLVAGSLEFAADPERFLLALAYSLRPGGRAVFLLPRGGWRGSFYARWHRRRGCPTQLIPEKKLTEWLGRAGLRVVRSRQVLPMSRVVEAVRSA